MKKMLLSSLLLVLVLCGCEVDKEKIESEGGEVFAAEWIGTVDKGYGGVSIYETTINGMPCLISSGSHEGGITCDWSKYQADPLATPR